MSLKLTVLFAPLDGHGHVNVCIGIAQALVKRGHRIVFAIDSAWKGKLRQLGFDEELHSAGGDEQEQNSEYWPEYIAQNAHLMQSPPCSVERLNGFNREALGTMFELQARREDQLAAIVNRVNPDVIVIDNYFESPSLTGYGKPWVWLFSANPLIAIPDDRTPPAESGLPIDGDKSEWKRFAELFGAGLKPVVDKYNEWLKSKGAPPCPPKQLHRNSPFLNMYQYPIELDYIDYRPLPDKWHRFDSFLRHVPDTFELPDCLVNKPGKLVFLSMGSFASADIALMKRLVDILKQSPHRFIFSKGACGDRYELADNMWGVNFLPQTKVLPLVDLVISHGGNNTLIESFYFGKPMIILPLFGDQFDNAQRLVETKLGKQLSAYQCKPEELLEAIEQMVNDGELAERMKSISKRMQETNDAERAADLIEQIAQA